MRESLVEVLADPESNTPLELETTGSSDGEVHEGVLRTRTGRTYSIVRGIPRFVDIEDPGQQQTAETFGFKWHQRDSYDSPGFREFALDWFLERYGFESQEDLRRFFSERTLTLDAGCGAGFTASLWLGPGWRGNGNAEWVGLDISTAIDVAQDRLGSVDGVHFVQGDVSHPPFGAGTFDTILSEGVLHHTPSTEGAIRALSETLAAGGEILFYVYRKKGPLREFADDYIRSIVSPLPADEAWEALRPLTRLAQSLAELETTVEVADDIPYLQIPAGEHDVQRLLYWNFLKLFWNPKLSFEENNHVNFDWYHPQYAHRQTEEELRVWCADCGLDIFHLVEQESGYTIRARKA